MAHFAKLDENNIVTEVIVVGNDCITNEHGAEQEELGVAFCKKLYGEDTKWKQTSYNSNLRKRYATIGMEYNEEHDVFCDQKPYPSWIFDAEEGSWAAPVPMPVLNDLELSSELANLSPKHVWNEEEQKWVLMINFNSQWIPYETLFGS